MFELKCQNKMWQFQCIPSRTFSAMGHDKNMTKLKHKIKYLYNFHKDKFTKYISSKIFTYKYRIVFDHTTRNIGFDKKMFPDMESVCEYLHTYLSVWDAIHGAHINLKLVIFYCLFSSCPPVKIDRVHNKMMVD